MPAECSAILRFRSDQTVAVRIRLLRMGKIRNPQYRIVVADSRTKRDGRAIEYLGIYHPKEEPSRIEVNSERAQYWLSVGAQPSEAIIAILSKTGDWQKFKGMPPPAEPLKVAPERASRHAAYEAEAKAAAGVEDAVKAKKAEPKKAEPRKAEPKKAEAKKAEPAKAEPAKAEPAKAEPAKAEPAKAEPAKAEPEAKKPEPEAKKAEPEQPQAEAAAPAQAEESAGAGDGATS
jgi:small subunit ribosomal protein S16